MDDGVPRWPLRAPKGIEEDPKGSKFLKIYKELFKKSGSGLIWKVSS